MQTYIDKNILLDDIIQSNSFLLLFYSPAAEHITSYNLINTIEQLRNNLSISDDIILFTKLIYNIDDVIVEKEYYKSIMSEYYVSEIETLNRIIYLLENTKYKIRIFIDNLNNIDNVDMLVDDMCNMDVS